MPNVCYHCREAGHWAPGGVVVAPPGWLHQVRNLRLCLEIAWYHVHVCEVGEKVRVRKDAQ